MMQRAPENLQTFLVSHAYVESFKFQANVVNEMQIAYLRRILCLKDIIVVFEVKSLRRYLNHFILGFGKMKNTEMEYLKYL